MAKKRISIQNPPKHKKTSNPFFNSSVTNNSKSIYTYSKPRKPKRIGKECVYFVPDKCICKLSRLFCKNAVDCTSFQYKKEHVLQAVKPKTALKKSDITEVGVTAIVLNDNRKCTIERHLIQDIQAKIRVCLYPSSEIAIREVPGAYCKVCDAYFILKKDFMKLKEQGVILCPIIDETQEHLAKIKNWNPTGSESRIHQLGYNVKRGNGYTQKQRQVVLANIVENTDISRHEIISNISRCIAQHKTQPNYANCIKCWQNDLDFISNYKIGDMPEVVVNKITIGKR